MKRCLSLVLSVWMILSCASLPSVMAQGEMVAPALRLPEQEPTRDQADTVEGLVYQIENQTVTITDYTGLATDLVIPHTVEGYPVKAIGESAFSFCRSIKSIVLPDGVTDIKKNAFYFCDSMERIELPATLVSIGEQAFYNCGSLYSIELPATLTSIGKSAFLSCNCLAEVINHSSLALQKGSEDYGAVAYYAEEVHRSSSKMVVEDGFAFYPTPAGYLLIVCRNENEDPVFPTLDRPCCAIRSYAFCSFDSIKSIVIPEGVQSIGNCAFIECTALERVELPSSLLRVGDFVFYHLDSLKEGSYNGTKEQWDAITWGEWNNSLLDARLSFAAQCTHSYFDACDTDCNVCKAVREAPHCYYNACDTDCNLCGLVREITHRYVNGFCQVCGKEELPESLHPYPNNANEEYLLHREGAVALAVTFSPDTFVETGWDHIYLYDKDGNQVLSYTTGTSLAGRRVVVMGDSLSIVLQSDSSGVYYGFSITKLEVCYGHSCLQPAETDCAICGAVRQVSHHYENGLCKTCSWPEGLEYTVADGEVTVNGYEGNAVTMVIPSTVEGLPVTVLTGYAFNGCKTLVSVDLPNSIREIGQAVFAHCSALERISLPASLTRLETAVLYNCDSLVEVEIPAGVTEIGYNAFGSCEKLTEIGIPSGVTQIENLAFDLCPSLRTVYYTGSKAQWMAISVGSNNSHLTNAQIVYHYGRDHSFDDPSDAICNECDYRREVGTDGKILLRTDKSTVIVGRPFDVYVDLNALTEPVGSVDFHLLLSENLEYVSHEILVNSSDFMLTTFDPASLYFGCGMTVNGVTGEYPLLKLSLVATAEGAAEVKLSLHQGGEGVGNLAGDGRLDFVSGDPLHPEAIVHVCVFDQERAEERYLIHKATCTEGAQYYKSCECGEAGTEPFTYGSPLGHSYQGWMTDDTKHWHCCSVCSAVEDEGEHSYTDFWDADCQICSALRPRPLQGDVNGDGAVSFADIQRIYTHRITDSALTGDALIIADVNRDGVITFGDIQRLYQHLTTDQKLY